MRKRDILALVKRMARGEADKLSNQIKYYPTKKATEVLMQVEDSWFDDPIRDKHQFSGYDYADSTDKTDEEKYGAFQLRYQAVIVGYFDEDGKYGVNLDDFAMEIRYHGYSNQEWNYIAQEAFYKQMQRNASKNSVKVKTKRNRK